MNSKSVLSRIAKMLSLSDETPIQAKTEDGKILQSSNFDVNDDIVEIGADGKTTPLADGEYTITFTTPEGVESTQVVTATDGKISELSTPEEEAADESGEEEMDDAMPTDVTMSDAGTTTDPTKGDTQNRKDINKVPGSKVADTMLAKDYIEAPKGTSSKEPAHALPNTTDEDPRNSIGSDTDDKKDPIISLSYRITELEKALTAIHAKLAEAKTDEETDTKEEEPTVAKLDGAPVDETMSKVNLSGIHKPTTNKVGNSQNSFLSKLYN
jgi:hypothetical protein